MIISQIKCGTFRNFDVLNDEKIQPWQNTGGGNRFNKKTTAKNDVPNANPCLMCSHSMVHLRIFTRKPVFGVQIRVHTGKLFFLFLNQNICCRYSKKLSH